MKRFFFILLLVFATTVAAQQMPPGVEYITTDTVGGASIMVVRALPVRIFRSAAARRRNERLENNVRKVYPIALEAEKLFRDMEAKIATLPRSRQKAYVAAQEREIQKKYTPLLRQMTFSQGKILIKLIDRQTSRTSYDILREMRGRFSASLWQGVAKLFEADLNAAYDPMGEDRQIEEIISRIDRGQL